MKFRNWVLQNFPFLEDDFDALTDYELFCKMMEYVINFSKDNENFKKELNDLKNYIDNLDLTEEVNKKLDEMSEDGTLENLIGQYIELATTYVYNNIDELKQATNLVNGSFARTSGFYSYNDGGGAYYKIRNVTTSDIIDNIFLIPLENNLLIAERLVLNQTVNSVSCGIKNDGITDITDKLQNVINYCSEKGYKLFMQKGSYLISNSITITNRIIIEGEQLPRIWEGYINDVKIICNLQDKPCFVITKSGIPYNWENYTADLLADIQIKNLSFIGNSEQYSLCGIFATTYLSNFENLFFQYFKNGITASGCYETDFKKVITYNTYFGFIANNCNTTTRLIESWFENINNLDGSESITDTNFINLYNFMDNYIYTCIANYNGRIKMQESAIEFNNYGIYNKNGFVRGDNTNIENIYNTDLLCNSSNRKSFIDLRDTYIWSPQTVNALVGKTFNVNSKINLELLSILPDGSIGHGRGYDIAENSIFRVYSEINGERIITANKTNIPLDATIIEKSHYTKNGFKIDITIKDFSSWDGNSISRLTNLPTNRGDFRFLGIGTIDTKNFKLSQFGNLTYANNNWIDSIANYEMHILHEFSLE